MERNKLQAGGKYDSQLGTKIKGEYFMCTYNEAPIILIPLTVCQFGSIGPMSRALFFGDSPLDRPKGFHRLPPQHQLVHNNTRPCSQQCPRLHRPQMTPRSPGSQMFWNTYPTTLTFQWSMHILSFNITRALANHLFRGISLTQSNTTSNISCPFIPGQGIQTLQQFYHQNPTQQ